MKTVYITLIFLIGLFSNSLLAQDCNLYLPADLGTKWEITNFNAKGKAQSISKFELINKVTSGTDITFTVKTSYCDEKGREQGSSTFDAFCKNGVFEFDFEYFLNNMNTEAYEEMNIEVEMDMTTFELARFSDPVGTKLDDYTITMDMKTNGMGTMSMKMEYKDRELMAKESRTTTAGTFDCIVVSQNISTKMSIIDTETSSKDWYSEGVGMVRSEYYSKKGKLESYTELTSLTK
ncbi:MAG: hypothetical protein AB8B53_06245 [Flavobacteriales bacterium]